MHRERRRAEINLEAAERAERSLSEKERFASQIAELSPVVINVLDLATRRDVYISPDVTNLLGYTPQEIAEMEDPFSVLWHPEDIPRANEHLALLKHARDGEITEFEYRIRRRDGEWRWVASRIIPFERDEHGAVRQIVTASLDITERKQAEDALRRSEDRARLIIDTIPTMAWRIRPDGAVDFVNQRWLDYTGLSLEEEIEEPTRPMHPEDIPRAMEKWLADKAAGEPSEDEMRLRRADGEYRWFLVRTAPLRDEQGNLVKWYGVTIDIEDRKQAEEKLKATSEQLRALSASLQSAREEEATRIAREIHDELGATLSSLRWDLEDVDEIVSKSEDRSQLQKLRKKIEAMMKLTDTILNTVRRIASELRPSVLDELGLVVAIKWQARQFQNRTGIFVHCDCPLDNVDLNQAQSTAVFRIFQEALTNILRHAQATRVNIQMNKEDDQFTLTINDKDEELQLTRNRDPNRSVSWGCRNEHISSVEISISSGLMERVRWLPCESQSPAKKVLERVLST